MFYVYVLLDSKTGKHYTGHTNDLDRRIREHTAKQSPYTRNHGPFTLVHEESYSTRSEAIKRELHLKSGHGREELKNILGI